MRGKPWQTLADLTAAMKEKGEKATYGASANIGLIMGALYRELAGLKAVDVQYKSAPDSLNDLASGATRLRALRSDRRDRAGAGRTRPHSRRSA